jgi:hypothetical protein
MTDAPAAAVFCGEMCNGCKDDCAACATMACGDCGGCEHGRELSRRGRAATAALELLQVRGPGEFRFDKNQRRDSDGRWVDMGGADSTGGGRGATPQHDLVRRLQRIVEFDEEEKGPAPTPSYTAEVAQNLQQALDSGDQAEIARWEKRALAIVDDQEKYRGLNEPDLGDGVARGKLGFRALRMQQRAQIEGKLTREQIQGGLEEYLSNPGGYKAINQAARNRSVPFDKMTKTQQARVRQLDQIASVFEQDATTLQQDTEVWRGVRDPGAFLGDLEPGMEFVDDAPVSTSMDRDWATNFATDWGKKKITPENSAILKIRLKKGQKGLVGAAVAGEFSDKTGWEQEREVLLPPGSRFRVISKTDDTDAKGKKVSTYEVEVVETPVLAPRAPAKRASNKVEEPGRNLKKAKDLPLIDRSKVIALMRSLRDEGGHKSTDAPELQDALVEAIKRDIDLNTRSAKLILKDLNTLGGITW